MGTAAVPTLRPRRQLPGHCRHQLRRRHSAVYQGAVERGILCTAWTTFQLRFFFGSVVSRGELQIAISQPARALPSHSAYAGKSTSSCPRSGPWLENLGRSAASSCRAPPHRGTQIVAPSTGATPVCESASCPSRQIALAPIDSRMRTREGSTPGRSWSRRSGPAHRQGTAPHPERRRPSPRRSCPECNSRPGPVRL